MPPCAISSSNSYRPSRPRKSAPSWLLAPSPAADLDLGSDSPICSRQRRHTPPPVMRRTGEPHRGQTWVGICKGWFEARLGQPMVVYKPRRSHLLSRLKILASRTGIGSWALWVCESDNPVSKRQRGQMPAGANRPSRVPHFSQTWCSRFSSAT